MNIVVAVLLSATMSPMATEVVIDVHMGHKEEEEEEEEEQMTGRESEALEKEDEDKVITDTDQEVPL